MSTIYLDFEEIFSFIFSCEIGGNCYFSFVNQPHHIMMLPFPADSAEYAEYVEVMESMADEADKLPDPTPEDLEEAMREDALSAQGYYQESCDLYGDDDW